MRLFIVIFSPEKSGATMNGNDDGNEGERPTDAGGSNEESVSQQPGSRLKLNATVKCVFHQTHF
jgi:hypothetical protein